LIAKIYYHLYKLKRNPFLSTKLKKQWKNIKKILKLLVTLYLDIKIENLKVKKRNKKTTNNFSRKQWNKENCSPPKQSLISNNSNYIKNQEKRKEI